MTRPLFFILSGLVLLILSVPQLVLAAAAPPQIISYQGRLGDGDGDLLGSSSGTTYYFKFSLWNTATINTGSRVWPADPPTATTATVRDGVFSINIGDTANGYPDTLSLNFSEYSSLYLQIEVSSNGTSFETLGPRQALTSVAFAQSASSVTSLNSSSFGTTSPLRAAVTAAASSSASSALALVGANNQSADLFDIFSSAFEKLFYVNNTGGIFGSSTLQVSGAVRLYDSLTALGNSTFTHATSTSFFQLLHQPRTYMERG